MNSQKTPLNIPAGLFLLIITNKYFPGTEVDKIA